MKYLFLTVLFAPIWFPLVRLAVSFFKFSRPSKVATWWYVIAFSWATGWVMFQWSIKIPSGIGYFLALVSGWFIMLVGIITEVITKSVSRDQLQNEKLSSRFSWAVILVVGIVAAVLWARHEHHQNSLKAEAQSALNFVRNNNAVVQTVGSSFDIYPSSSTTTSDGVPLRYEFSLSQKGSGTATQKVTIVFAIVSVSRSTGSPTFVLECLTPLSIGYRDPFKDPCKQ